MIEGGPPAVASLLEADVEEMDDMIALNVTALTGLTYAVAAALVARRAGTIINIASVVGISPATLNGVYGASKPMSLHSPTRCSTSSRTTASASQGMELAPRGRRVRRGGDRAL